MRISLIVAMSENRVIGSRGRLPWRLAADLRRFQRLTMGHHLVMGRKTFESIGRALPGRTSIVITRQPDYTAQGARVATDLETALEMTARDDEVFVIGGEQIYRLAVPCVERMYITEVSGRVEGDAHFPELRDEDWQVVEQANQPADDDNAYAMRFLVLDRRR